MTALRASLLAFIILAAAPISPLALSPEPVYAQDSGFDAAFTFSADIVLAPGDSPTARPGLLGELRAGMTTERILENTQRIGFEGGLVVRRDSGRAGLARSFGTCPADIAGCAGTGGLAPAGSFSGLVAAPGLEGDDPAVAVETGYVYWRSGFVEVRGGYGPGAAQLESEALPGAFWLMRADGPRADPAGLNLASTTNTLSGHAPKILLRSVRLAGFRASASYTPDGDVCGASYCRPSGREGMFAASSVRDIAELGLSFDHLFRQSGVRWTAGLGLAQGRAANAGLSYFDDPWAVSARIIRSQGDWKAGFSALVSNDGVSGERYRAEAVSLSHERGDWLFSVEASRARATLVRARSETVMAGVSRYFDPGFLIGIGIAHSEADTAIVRNGTQGLENQSETRAFVEAGLRF